MKKIILALIMMSLPFTSFAHEGHDKTPGALPLDGFDQIQATDQFYLKLKIVNDGVKIYPFDHDNKAVPVSGIKLEGTAKFPKKAKAEKVSFSSEGESFLAKVMAKGAHRYTLEVTVIHAGKKEKAKFNVEPQ